MAQGKEHCWCMSLPAVMPVCANAKCLCPNCLQREIEAIQIRLADAAVNPPVDS
jgi:hypothetical protein